MPYLSEEALTGLKAYVYKPAGYTWLDNLHQPLWNWMVDQLPLWLAPNLITFTGLLGVLATYLLIIAFQPSFSGSSPGWVLVLTGLSVCLYANLDCIDGKQARRTKSSSPLGQLFDHGCDAYIVHLLVGDIMACMATSCGWRASLCIFWIACAWILAQLEEYHTGTMLYGNGIWGVLEILYSTAFVCFVTAVVGPSYWTTPLLFLKSDWNIHISLADVGLAVVTLTGGSQTLGQLWRILMWDSKSLTLTERGHKELGFSNIVWHLCIVFVLLLSGCVWILTAHEEECRFAYASFGTVYSLISTQLIIAHMAKTAFVPLRGCLSSLIVLAANSFFRVIHPFWLTLLSCAIYHLLYGHYVLSVVQQICSYLDIWCLSIKKPKDDTD